MDLKSHIIDTIKEWQLKIGEMDQSIRLYYPKESLCNYLGEDKAMDIIKLSPLVEDYLSSYATYLGKINVSNDGDRFCLEIPVEGCKYVEENIDVPEFLNDFLTVLKNQNMGSIRELFRVYANKHKTSFMEAKEDDGLGTVFYFVDEKVDPYVYCVEQDVFGITYHRFARIDYEELAL